jgi:predicted NACHT family NTPase
MLSQIAWRTFSEGNYFFKQKLLEIQICKFIRNLSGASNNEQELELDSEVVLKSLEAQHGLFVERARGIYSFSHLTFHEYFAAREVKEKMLFTSIARHVAEKRWREVILLTVGMMSNADLLMRHLRQSTDDLIADDRHQEILAWVNSKAQAAKNFYKPSAI